MKILYVNRPKSWWTGGDYVQMEKTAQALRKLGVQVDIVEVDHSGVLPVDAGQYDIIQVFNFSMGWSKVLLNKKAPHQRYVASMIYHETEQDMTYEVQQQMLDNLDAAIFLAPGELSRVTRHLTINPNIIHFVPNGIDEFWFSKGAEWAHKFVLTTGRVEEFKGQRSVAAACEKLKLPYICVGGKESYQDGFMSVVPSLPHEQLLDYYANCSVFVLASKSELWPLAAMEAGAQAKNIVITDQSCWIPTNAETVTYGDVKGIAKAIERSLKKGPNTQLQAELREMTWDNVARKLLDIYEDIVVG